MLCFTPTPHVIQLYSVRSHVHNHPHTDQTICPKEDKARSEETVQHRQATGSKNLQRFLNIFMEQIWCLGCWGKWLRKLWREMGENKKYINNNCQRKARFPKETKGKVDFWHNMETDWQTKGTKESQAHRYYKVLRAGNKTIIQRKR